ncbi:MAG: prolipoprotein diacylglyceryl transferase [Bacteroidetes bacterium HGW-Bacteroidetes-6]|jgi:prolipoprotein diacylglyceryl transferase|nr:MAG: prolipoprotein diacylglyceryl transferase [Bacteroidetes bacterium HGW-Bacteroidetes-6]
MSTGFIVWDVDPVIFTLGPMQVRYYGLLFAMGFLIGYYIVRYFFQKEKAPLAEIDKMALYIILGSIIGARLGHVIFYEPEEYLKDPIQIFMIWKGGLASHGGAIGLAIGLWLYSRKSWNKSVLHIMDRIAVPTALASSFIRLGNLFNSEIYGFQTDLPWGFIFVRDGQTIPHHPTQIYESLGYLIIFIVLFIMYNHRKGIINRGLLVGWLFTLVFVLRFFVEFIKNVQVDFEKNMTLDMGQWLSIPFVMIGILLIIRSKKLGPAPVVAVGSTPKAKK